MQSVVQAQREQNRCEIGQPQTYGKESKSGVNHGAFSSTGAGYRLVEAPYGYRCVASAFLEDEIDFNEAGRATAGQ